MSRHHALRFFVHRFKSLSGKTTFPRFEWVDASYCIEEQTISGYKAQNHYPVDIGQVFNSRCKVIGKIGYGSASTVWLCRDLETESEYVALKVYINNSEVQRGLSIYKHINAIQLEHGGRENVRKLLESFEIDGPHGRHVCLVRQPLRYEFQRAEGAGSRWCFRGGPGTSKNSADSSWSEFLHEAHIIHTDLQPNNMLVGINDPSIFTMFEHCEDESPVPRKEQDGRTIYMSRPMPFSKGVPVSKRFE